MYLLLDENVTRKLVPLLTGHTAVTAQQMGWAGKSNGELLGAMTKAGLSMIITMDRNLQFQLPLEKYGVKVVVLSAKGNSIEALRPLVVPLIRYLDEDAHDLVRVIEA